MAPSSGDLDQIESALALIKIKLEGRKFYNNYKLEN